MPAANGSVQLRALAARLRAAGARDVRLQMTRQLRAAAAPIVPDIQDAARQSLPKRGGMNTYMAAQKPKVSVRTTGRQAGVSIKYSGTGAPSDTGRWRHPVYGNTKRWVQQSYPSAEGWYERGAAKGTPQAQVQMRAVLATVAAEIQRLGI